MTSRLCAYLLARWSSLMSDACAPVLQGTHARPASSERPAKRQKLDGDQPYCIPFLQSKMAAAQTVPKPEHAESLAAVNQEKVASAEHVLCMGTDGAEDTEGLAFKQDNTVPSALPLREPDVHKAAQFEGQTANKQKDVACAPEVHMADHMDGQTANKQKDVACTPEFHMADHMDGQTANKQKDVACTPEVHMADHMDGQTANKQKDVACTPEFHMADHMDGQTANKQKDVACAPEVHMADHMDGQTANKQKDVACTPEFHMADHMDGQTANKQKDVACTPEVHMADHMDGQTANKQKDVACTPEVHMADHMDGQTANKQKDVACAPEVHMADHMDGQTANKQKDVACTPEFHMADHMDGQTANKQKDVACTPEVHMADHMDGQTANKQKDVACTPEVHMADHMDGQTAMPQHNVACTPEVHMADHMDGQTANKQMDVACTPEVHMADHMDGQTAMPQHNVACTPEVHMADHMDGQTANKQMDVACAPEVHMADHMDGQTANKQKDVACTPEFHMADHMDGQTANKQKDVACAPEVHMADHMDGQTAMPQHNVACTPEVHMADHMDGQTANKQMDVACAPEVHMADHMDGQTANKQKDVACAPEVHMADRMDGQTAMPQHDVACAPEVHMADRIDGHIATIQKTASCAHSLANSEVLNAEDMEGLAAIKQKDNASRAPLLPRPEIRMASNPTVPWREAPRGCTAVAEENQGAGGAQAPAPLQLSVSTQSPATPNGKVKGASLWRPQSATQTASAGASGRSSGGSSSAAVKEGPRSSAPTSSARRSLLTPLNAAAAGPAPLPGKSARERFLGVTPGTRTLVLLQAMAGAGKTQTIIDFIKQWPHYKFLYLVFNVKMRDEMESRAHQRRLTSSLKIRTVDSFCKQAACSHLTAGNVGEPVNLDSESSVRTLQALLPPHLKLEFTDVQAFQAFCNSCRCREAESELCQALWRFAEEGKFWTFDTNRRMLFEKGFAHKFDAVLVDEAQVLCRCTCLHKGPCALLVRSFIVCSWNLSGLFLVLRFVSRTRPRGTGDRVIFFVMFAWPICQKCGLMCRLFVPPPPPPLLAAILRHFPVVVCCVACVWHVIVRGRRLCWACGRVWYVSVCHMVRADPRHALFRRPIYIFCCSRQDLAEPVLGWLRTLPCLRVLVGDAQQDIYAFQRKVNAMTITDADAVYELNVSYRLTPRLGAVVNHLLQSVGLECRVVPGRCDTDVGVDHVLVLARNNSKLLEFMYQVAPLVERSGGALQLQWDAAKTYLSPEHWQKEALPWGEKFFKDSFRYFPKLDKVLAWLRHLIDRKPRASPQTPVVTLTLSTVHKAKGSEANFVLILDDVRPEEASLTYVALTRPKEGIALTAPIFSCHGVHGSPQLTAWLEGLCRRPPGQFLPPITTFLGQFPHSILLQSLLPNLPALLQRMSGNGPYCRIVEESAREGLVPDSGTADACVIGAGTGMGEDVAGDSGGIAKEEAGLGEGARGSAPPLLVEAELKDIGDYSLMGTSIDYLIRIMCERFCSEHVRSWHYTAEGAVCSICTGSSTGAALPGLELESCLKCTCATSSRKGPPKRCGHCRANDLVAGIVDENRAARRAYIELRGGPAASSAVPPDALCRSVWRLSACDTRIRAGEEAFLCMCRRKKWQLLPATPAQVRIMQQTCRVALEHAEWWGARAPMHLNPVCGGAQVVLSDGSKVKCGPADADLVYGDVLVDFKWKTRASVTVPDFLQLMAYAKLLQARGIPVQRVGIYFARHGVFRACDLNEVGDTGAFVDQLCRLWASSSCNSELYATVYNASREKEED